MKDYRNRTQNPEPEYRTGFDEPAPPSRKSGGCLFALVLAILAMGGVGYGIFVAWQGVVAASDQVQRVVIPGEGEVEFKEAGKKFVYYDYFGDHEGKVFMTGESWPDINLTVTDLAAGRPVNLVPDRSISYESGSSAGRSVFSFQAEAGKYKVSGEYPRDAEGREILLAVGGNFVAKIMLAILKGIGVGMASLLLAFLIFIVAVIKKVKPPSATM